MKNLSLGTELSKNEQKKVLGGVVFRCANPNASPIYHFSSCAHAASYCAGAQSSPLDYCYN